MGYWGCINSPRDEINLFTLDVLDHHNVLLGKEMEGEVAHCLTEDALLEKYHINSSLDNFLD